MAFRDDEAALRERISALEAEQGALRAGLSPRITSLRRRFFVFGVVMIAGSGAALYLLQQTVEQARTIAQRDRAECAQQVEAGRGALARAESETRAARADADAARATAEQLEAALAERARSPSPTPVRGFRIDARVVRTDGASVVRAGTSCSVDVSYQPLSGDCHATVACGAVPLYPRGGGGFFACDVADARIVAGRDANPTPRSGDPRIDVDVQRRSVVVSDEEPDWSVTLGWR